MSLQNVKLSDTDTSNEWVINPPPLNEHKHLAEDKSDHTN